MSDARFADFEGLGRQVESVGKRLQELGKKIQKAETDPFAARSLCRSVNEVLADTEIENLKANEAILTSLNNACEIESAEFWSRFSAATTREGWTLIGATERRLLAYAFFISAKGDQIQVEGVTGSFTPHVPALISALKPIVARAACTDAELSKFADILERAWEACGGQGEILLEDVYRQFFVVNQPNSFWDSVEPQKINHVSRPIFRSRLSFLLSREVRSRKGRRIRFGTTLNPREAWEIFSQGEGRVVQVGRIIFEDGGRE